MVRAGSQPPAFGVVSALMSDAPQSPGWWQASDGKWYPPETHPDYQRSTLPPPPTSVGGVIEATGVTGTVTFDGRFVVINRSGMMARMTVGKGEKRIPLRSIAAIQFKPAGMVRGFIQFTIPGGNEQRSRMGSQSKDAAKDENSVLFNKGQEAAFEQLRDAIEAQIA